MNNIVMIQMKISRYKKEIAELEDKLEKEFYALDEAMKEEEKELVMV